MSAAAADRKPRLTTSAMIASIASEGQKVRAAPFGKALVEYAANRPEVVGLTADLAKYTDLHLFAQAYPERFFQMGMAEQLLMGAAGGLAKEGLVPFATTYAAFGTRRAFDFIHQVIAEEDLNVKICCALPGLTTGYGPSHAAIEDIAMMRGVPGLTIVDPCDALDIEQAVPQIAQHKGPVYMRRRCRRSRSTRARCTCACCAARCRWCSTRSKAIASSSARPRCCARAPTCW